MPITDQSKVQLKNRLSRAMGHLDYVYRMVDEKQYCVDVLHQLKAVQSALDKVSEAILKQHLETCVVEAMQHQDHQRVIDELVQVFRKAPQLDLSDLQQAFPSSSDPSKESQLAGDDSQNHHSCCGN